MKTRGILSIVEDTNYSTKYFNVHNFQICSRNYERNDKGFLEKVEKFR